MSLVKNRIRTRLLLCILAPIIAVFVVTRVSISLVIRPYLEELLMDRSAYMGERRIDQFDSLQSQLYSTAQSLIGNETIQDSLRRESPYRTDHMQFEKILRYYVFDDILNITYVSSDMTQVFHAYQTSTNPGWVLELIGDTDLSDNYAKPVWIVAGDDAPGGEKQFYVLQKLRHLTIDVAPGYLLYHVRQAPLEQIVSTAGEAERVTVLDSAGAVLFPHESGGEAGAYDPELFSADARYDGRLRVALENGRLTSRYADPKTGWQIVSCADYDDVMGRYNGLQALITTITVIIAIGGCALIYLLTFHYTRPITTITRSLQSFENGRFQVRIEQRLPDEFAIIGESFNHMADRIDTLIADVERSREDLKVAELDSLMYQINPHFIYNTLNNIYMLARMSGQRKLTTLIDSLSRFLRISLSKGSSIIMVRDEIEHVSSYLAIQQTRYGELFDYDTEVDIQASQAMVLKFILQPLVENAISHGFAGMEKGGHIAIRAYTGEGGICLEIADNGCGMSPAVMERLESARSLTAQELRDLFPEREGGYGIGNVIARLSLYYGDGYSLLFADNHPGTRCVIKIQEELCK